MWDIPRALKQRTGVRNSEHRRSSLIMVDVVVDAIEDDGVTLPNKSRDPQMTDHGTLWTLGNNSLTAPVLAAQKTYDASPLS